MRSSYLLPLTVAMASFVTADNMVPSSGSATFPACAIGCRVLLQAQQTCTPPNAIKATQITYDNCFCQIPTVQDLYTTGETLCTSNCSSHSDRALLSTWFVNFCKEVGSGVDPVAATDTGTPATSTTSGAEATSSSQTYSSGSSSSTSDEPWVKTHWQWIVMLIFLFFGLLGIGLGARWYKKRHDRQVDQEKATTSGFPATENKPTNGGGFLSPGTWRSHQRMAASKNYQYTPNSLPDIDESTDDNSTAKDGGKRSSRIEVTEVHPVPPPVHSKSP